MVQGCQTFTNSLKLNNIKSHKSCGHHPSLNGSSDKKPLGIGNCTYPPQNRVNPFHASDLFLCSLKTRALLMFSVAIERDQWPEIG